MKSRSARLFHRLTIANQRMKIHGSQETSTHTQDLTEASTAEIEFYTECAELEGLTLEQWLAKEPF